MPQVFVHTRETPDDEWHNEGREFLRLPVVGEFFALTWDSDWYRVELVVHCPFEADYAAEIYGTRVDHLKAMKSALG